MDSLYLKTGMHGIASPISASRSHELRTNQSQLSTVGRSSMVDNKKPHEATTSSFPLFSFKYSLKSFWRNSRYKGMAMDDPVLVENEDENKISGLEEDDSEEMGPDGKKGNWVLNILHARSLWKEEKNGEDDDNCKGEEDVGDDEEEEEECDVCKVDDEIEDEEDIEFDRDSFSRLLRRVSLAEARLYAQMSYLGNLTYCIPRIKPGNLLRYYGLRFITSSLEKRELAVKAEKNQPSFESKEPENLKDNAEAEEQKKNMGQRISASAAYDIAASSASYLYSQTKSVLPYKSSKAKSGDDSTEPMQERDHSVNMMNSEEMASLMATTDSVTAVVAAKEEVKQAVADNLNSTCSSPCEWFICDDDQSGTRFFVVQGSESLASWQANLLFEPIQFEGLDVLVHRGIYEAAKGIYEQMLPEVLAHLESRKDSATFRFTGHSLGGSLALLLNLMLLIRGQVPISSLLPVITFGAPSIMCGGDLLLRRLGLPRSHVQAVTMHRDIVPRAFSCKYPSHVAELLKAVSGNFRNHPCLNNQKLLYTPMGELLILQPDDKFSPSHHLLPSGSGLYLLQCPLSDARDTEKRLRLAKMAFLNSPHPLEILSDRSAYGSDGTIIRDHDMNSYLKCIRGVIRQELNQIRKAKREHHRKVWWPLVSPQGINVGIITGRPVVSIKLGRNNFNFSGIVQSGKESLKRFSSLVTSQHVNFFVVLLLPARLLFLEVYSNLIGFR